MDLSHRVPPGSTARLFRVVSVILLVLAAGGCAGARGPRLVALPDPGARAVGRVDAIHDYPTAAASIARTFEHALGFPAFPVTFQFFRDRGAFEAALVGVGYEPAFARDTAARMSAVGGHRQVLVNEASLEGMSWAQRTALMAHELGHSLQYELGGGRRGASDQWLREGFADWVSIQVLEQLGGISYAEYRRRQGVELRSGGRRNVPALAEMVTFPQWVALGARRAGPAYAHAFLAVDVLIDRHGLPAVLRYFELFAESQDRAGNFRSAFGEELDTFAAALSPRLWH